MTGTASQAGTYPNIGFVNTVISSAGTTALGTVAAQPVTGTFRADAINSLPAAFVVQNPLGFVSDATGFADLYSTPNGTYTLALADGGPADFGTLTSWTLEIDYQVGVPATGVWAPITTPPTIFTDAAATIPYTGTPANDVYVKPNATTDYSVVITTAVCVSPPTIVNVKVNNPVNNVSTVANAATCENGNASFTVTADGGTINYQWQISTDGGTTWSNVTNGGIYAGATTSTLTLTGVGTGSDGDQFRAVLTVPTCNNATTNAATLTVHANPTISIATAVTQLYPSLTTTLTASGGTGTYKWYKNGVEVAGATASTLVVTIDELGEYSAMVTDVNGCSSATSNSITISAAANDILFIYPSPNTGSFQVRYQSPNGDQLLPRNLTIFDSKGSRVFFKSYIINAPYGKMDVVMPQNAKGIYRVELTDRNGNRIKTGSVLIL